MLYSQWQYLMSLAAKLYPLEEMTIKSQVYDAIRQVMSCCARVSEAELHHIVGASSHLKLEYVT